MIHVGEHHHIHQHVGIHMVSMCQEQHSIMNFAVTFLKMPALYMLWRAQILTDLHAVFCVHQIRISVPP